ncbi:MAG: hypothetical protein ABI670_01205 [Chloroflexota bacterium]
MKKTSIKQHLSPYSIYQKRKTTISHAFASALAPADTYDETLLDEAITFLGQDPDSDLCCVYCGGIARTWDHLISLVKAGELRGFGHQVGNMVPCCAECNSRKGAQDWEQFIELQVPDESTRAQLRSTLSGYVERFAHPLDLAGAKVALPEQWEKYLHLRKEIWDLMREADTLAAELRLHLLAARRAG